MGDGIKCFRFFTSKNSEDTSCLHSSTLKHSWLTASKAVTANQRKPHCLLDRGLVSLGSVVMYWWCVALVVHSLRVVGRLAYIFEASLGFSWLELAVTPWQWRGGMEDCCLFRNLTVVQNFILLQIGRHFTTVEESDYPVMQSFTLVNQFRPGCSFCSLEGSITFSNKVDDIVGTFRLLVRVVEYRLAWFPSLYCANLQQDKVLDSC